MKTIGYVVNLVQNDLQDYTSHGVSRMTQFAIDCLKGEMGFKASPSINVAYLHPNSVGNAPMPMDFEYVVKMSVNICGLLYTLSVNNDLALNRNIECGTEVDNTSSLEDLVCTCNESGSTTADIGVSALTAYPGYWVTPHWRGGQFVAEMYGIGGGFNALGYYRLDNKMRQFQFYNIPSYEYILLEYGGDDNASAQTLIPYSAVSTIRNYVHWQMLRFQRDVNQWEKQKAENLFRRALTDYTYIQTAPTVSQYLDELWSSLQSSPKR